MRDERAMGRRSVRHKNFAVSERGDEAAHCETGDIAHLLALGDERLQRITMLETVQADRNWCELWMQRKHVVVLSEPPYQVGII